MAAARVCENQDMQDTQNIQEFCGTIRKPLPGPLFGQHRGQALCAAGHRAPRAQPPAEKMPRHCLMCAAARRGRSRQKEKMARPRATQAAPVPRRENLPGPGWAPTEMPRHNRKLVQAARILRAWRQTSPPAPPAPARGARQGRHCRRSSADPKHL
ncbi:unnamed protein product [Prorocentrum cordatum]|uniref:Uncharacterized protein n=1 Tax=Prorocentrum cordatum TaxID=2364126 RepID=A0ABN9VM03_9DINO|nr:unnamed protein product [Polarella glacialis]